MLFLKSPLKPLPYWGKDKLFHALQAADGKSSASFCFAIIPRRG